MHDGMAGEDPLAERLHRLAVADVAPLDLAADLVGERAKSLLATGDEDARPALRGEQPRRLLADARRGPRYDRDALNVLTVPRLISTVSRMSSA